MFFLMVRRDNCCDGVFSKMRDSSTMDYEIFFLKQSGCSSFCPATDPGQDKLFLTPDIREPVSRTVPGSTLQLLPGQSLCSELIRILHYITNLLQDPVMVDGQERIRVDLFICPGIRTLSNAIIPGNTLSFCRRARI